MTEELQHKIKNNIRLTDEEAKELTQFVMEREEKERREHPLPPTPPKPKSQGQKIIDGDIPCPPEYKIINGKLVYKTPDELYRSKVISKEEYSDYKRNIRDRYLVATDKYMLSDYPISKAELERVKEYRNILRNIPQKPDFPEVFIPEPPLI